MTGLRRRFRHLLPWGGLLGCLAVGLMLTNPGPSAFEGFAGRHLARVLRDELCHAGGLPMALRLVIHDCPALVNSQRAVLGQLTLQRTQRRNFGLFSLYDTSLTDQNLQSRWHLPGYSALTLAVAGQFLVLQSSEKDADGASGRQAWLPGGAP